MDLLNTTDGLAAYGFIRQNFDDKCWINDVIRITTRFYSIDSGSLYVFGNGKHGRLGLKTHKDKMCKIPTVCVPFDKGNALDVSAGPTHTLIVDVHYNVWCCGQGTYGELGNGRKEDLYVPEKLDLNIRVTAVSAGASHSLVLCDTGCVMSVGENSYGQLGHGNLEPSLTPKAISIPDKCDVTQICAGNLYSAILTKDGDLYCFGINFFGQCGVGGTKEEPIIMPEKVVLTDKVSFVECGFSHTLLITHKQVAYSFGNGVSGQLGNNSMGSRDIPTLIKTLENIRIKTCAAGSEHSLCVDSDGEMWSFGNNKFGQCGLPSNIKMQRTPKKNDWFIANNIKIKECAAAGNTSCVITEDGCLYIFGRNNHDESGAMFQLPFLRNAPIKKISMGRSHTAIIS